MQLTALLLWTAAVALAGASLWRALGVAVDQLAAPFDLVYETPNLRTIELLASNQNIYDVRVYTQAPFWITIYTPAYHYVVSWLPASATNPFLAGRLVAMACMLLAAGTVFAVAKKDVWAALLAVGAFFLVHPVVSNTAFLKNDSMGLLFSALSVVLLGETRRSFRWLVLSSVCAVAAFFCKQSFVAAGLAGFFFLLLDQRKQAFQFAALTALLLAVCLGLSRVAWGAGFWFCVFDALRNPMSWEHFCEVARSMGSDPGFVAILFLASAEAMRAAVYGGVRTLPASPYPLYALIAAVVMLGTLGKVGSSTNYCFETVLAALLWLVFSARRLVSASVIPRRVLGATLLLLGCAAADLAWTPRTAVSLIDPAARRARIAVLNQVASAIRGHGTPEPKILNLASVRLSHPLPGQISVSDPYLYSLLWRSGQLDPQSVVESLRRREFDGVFAIAPREAFAGAFLPSIEHALRSNYRASRHFGSFLYLVRIHDPQR